MQSTTTDTERRASARAPNDPPGVRQAVQILWNRRRVVAGIAGGLLFFTLALSLIMPKVYEARTSLLPPVQATAGFTGNPALDAPLGLLGMQGESMATAHLFEQILQSRSVMEGVIGQEDLLNWFELMKRPEGARMEEAVVALRAAVRFTVNPAGILETTVRLGTPWFSGRAAAERTRVKAASIANSFVAQLDRVNREKSLSRAKQTRVYLEKMLADNNGEIERLGTEVANFEKSHGAVALDVQTKVLVENAAALRARILSKQVELGIAEQSMTPSNPTLVGMRQEIDQLNNRLRELEGGSPGSSGWMDLPAGQIPQLQYRLARYERDVQAQLLLQGYLTQQLTQAKVEEARDAPSVQVLDPAIAPNGRISPKRKLMAIGGLLSGMILGTLGAALLEAFGSRRPR